MEAVEPRWRKSSYSGNGGDCVEVGQAARAMAVRDTKDRTGPVLRFTPAAWRKFAHRVKHSLGCGNSLTAVRRGGAGESACRPGSVTLLSVTWLDSSKCWLTCCFISHGFSSARVSFHTLAEQRRNWQISGRWRCRENSRPSGSSRTAKGRAPSWSSVLVVYRLSELVVCRTEVIPIDWAEDKFV